MTEHRIRTQEERQAERDALLKEEKKLTRAQPRSRAIFRGRCDSSNDTKSISCGGSSIRAQRRNAGAA